MCQICKDFELQKMSSQEALHNLQEIWNEEDPHHIDLWIKIIKKENTPPEDIF